MTYIECNQFLNILGVMLCTYPRASLGSTPHMILYDNNKKGNFGSVIQNHTIKRMKAAEVKCHAFLTAVLGGGGWTSLCSGRFAPGIHLIRD
jgi:hypothetical protein